jgi:hypothetical protein
MKLKKYKTHVTDTNIPQIVLRDSVHLYVAECGAWINEDCQKKADEIICAVNAFPALLENLQYISSAAPDEFLELEDHETVSVYMTVKAIRDIRAAIKQETP